MNTVETKTIRIGHSPDPDDAFMFYALAKNRIPMRGFAVEHVIEDIETLNQRALQGELEVTAVSCHAYAYMADKYLVMRSGSSVGDNYGPILVAKKNLQSVKGKKIAVPGKLTTAYLALQLFEKDFIPVFTPFDQILEAVQSGAVDVGLVIHEGQITYKEFGLEKFLDLGVWWHERTGGLPLPLGIDVIRRDLGEETIRSFSALFKESIQHALANRTAALEYALEYGRGIGMEAGDKFVGMYVNELTVDLGVRGEAGLRRLYDEAHAAGILPRRIDLEFV